MHHACLFTYLVGGKLRKYSLKSPYNCIWQCRNSDMPPENSVFRPVLRHLTESSSLCRWAIPHLYCCQPPFSASLTNSACSSSAPAASLAVTQTLKVCISSSSPWRFYPISSSPLCSPTTFSLPAKQPPRHSLCFPCHVRCHAVLHVWCFTYFILVTLFLSHATLPAGNDLPLLLSHRPFITFFHIFL